MKKYLIAFFTFFISLALGTCSNIPIANASTSIITLFEPTHRELNGKFIDDDLVTQLDMYGQLGSAIFNPPPKPRIWNIDAALIEDVIAMSQGYSLTSNTPTVGQAIATTWLMQLAVVTKTDPVYALPFGNPSGYWIHRLSPHDENYFLAAGKQRLQKLLLRPVKQLAAYPLKRYYKLDVLAMDSYKSAIKQMQMVSGLLPSADFDNLKLRSASFLTDSLDSSRRDFLARNLTATIFELKHKVHTVPGRFTITSSHQKLPITVVNDFPYPVSVRIGVTTQNSKIVLGHLGSVSLLASSKTQILIPVEVLTSGTSSLSVKLRTSQGYQIGDIADFPLTLSVISPVATWITTGAAITLFVAVIIQSFRRIRRRKA